VINMPDIVLVLGPVVFQDFEVPSGIVFGGRQRLAVHRLPGGARVIDALGRDDGRISFAGYFSGSDATLRARALDELRAAGIVLSMTWDVFFYSVLINEFAADYQNGWWIPYRITCTVLRDEASFFAQAALSLAASVLGDAASASDAAIGANVDLSSLQATLSAPNATQLGATNYASAQAGLQDAQAMLDNSIASAEVSLPSADPLGMDAPDAAVAGLLSATDTAGQLGALTTARAYVDRVAANLTNASS
jgi:hypothetical protein